MDILEETTRYILSLEQKLLDKVLEHGLPDKLDKLKDNSALSDDPSDTSTADNLEMNSLKTILHKFTQPGIQRRLQEKKMEEKKKICNILQTRHEWWVVCNIWQL